MAPSSRLSALPVGSVFPRPAKVVAVIGEPIPPPSKVGGRVPRRAVREFTETLYREFNDVFIEARVAAGDEDPPTD